MILLIGTIQMRSQTSDSCKWIRPVSWKYVKTHDIKDSSILTRYGTWDYGYGFLIKKTEDSTNCIFSTGRFQGAPEDLFILPSGNYSFMCYPTPYGTYTRETWWAKITITRTGESYFNENLRPGNYYKIVLISTDHQQTYHAELRNIGKEEIIKPFKKDRNLRITLQSAEMVALIAALFFLLK